jgi:biopolymer transport protein ExbD
MHFTTRKRRTAPTVIIVSLIDVLIVVLIFLMVTSTFKQQPSLKLSLPISKQTQKAGAADDALVLTVPKQGPLYLKTEPITIEALQQRLIEAVKQNPRTTLAIRADTDTPVGQLVRVMDAAKAANIQIASVFTRAAQ